MLSNAKLVNLLLLAPVVLATKAQQRLPFNGYSKNPQFNNVLATCDSGEVACEDGCMPSGSVCCDQGMSTYCDAGEYCTSDLLCCPDGELCSGEGTCDLGEVECDSGCMPLTGTCCNDGTGYCADFATCTTTGCCPLGESCDGEYGEGADDDDDDTFGTSFPTISTDFPTSFPTATADDEDFSLTWTTDLPTETDLSSTTGRGFGFTTTTDSSEPTETEGNAQPGVTPPPAPSAFGNNGESRFAADGKMAAGLAVAAAMLL
jgi:hypothetical protein